jgi:predicted DNA-binding transcriptional regulator AlpA
MDKLLTAAEVRATLKVSRQTVWRLEKSGHLNPVKVGTVKRYSEAEVLGKKKTK